MSASLCLSLLLATPAVQDGKLSIETYALDRERDALIGELTQLNQLSRELHRELDLPRLGEVLVSAAHHDLGWDGAALLFVESHHLQSVAAVGLGHRGDGGVELEAGAAEQPVEGIDPDRDVGLEGSHPILLRGERGPLRLELGPCRAQGGHPVPAHVRRP